MQQCSNGRDVMSKIGQVIRQNANIRNKNESIKVINEAYMKGIMDVNQKQLDNATPV